MAIPAGPDAAGGGVPAATVWTLTYPGVAYTWGSFASGVMDVKGNPPELSGHAFRADDAEVPRGDGQRFGQDYLNGQTITFDLLVLGADEAQVLDRVAEFARVWRADAVRLQPGEVAMLAADMPGRSRVTYGRPRRYAPAHKTTRFGKGNIVADFAAASTEWYGPDEQVEVVPLVPPPSGGLVTPLAAPLSTTPAAEVPGAITVAGDLPAWPVITLYGPIASPVVQVTGLWSLALATTIPAGQQVTVDTRPWRRTILRGDGASLAGTLVRSSVRLSDASIPPGRYEIALRGVDVSGTAQMRFAWQSTYASL